MTAREAIEKARETFKEQKKEFDSFTDVFSLAILYILEELTVHVNINQNVIAANEKNLFEKYKREVTTDL